MDRCGFTFQHYEESLRLAKEKGYSFSRLCDFDDNKESKLLILLRHDLDRDSLGMQKTLSMAEIENRLGIKATYFVRVHSDEYNPFGFKVYYALRQILNMGHEIGLHYEHLDFCDITKEDPATIIMKEKRLLELTFDIKIKGIAGHRDWTDIQNWDFWKDHNFRDFDFEYDAYEDKFMNSMLYIDNSLRHWKEGKCMCQYISNKVPRLYFLIHPFCWYHKWFQLER